MQTGATVRGLSELCWVCAKVRDGLCTALRFDGFVSTITNSIISSKCGLLRVPYVQASGFLGKLLENRE